MDQPRHIDSSEAKLAESLSRIRTLDVVRSALAGSQSYLVGGAVRDILLGEASFDLDICVVGDASEAMDRLGAVALSGGRFETAVADVDGTRVDIARARRETYAAPGALPDVEPAGIEDDLRRRDFTINAMAIPLEGPPALIDPFGGLRDLEQGLLRVLHSGSFEDDPTRALRGARYAARYGLSFEEETRRGLSAADLGSVSRERVAVELRLCAEEECVRGALSSCADLGLVEISEDARMLCARLCEELTREPWTRLRREGILDAASVLLSGSGLADAAQRDRARAIAEHEVEAPSDALEVAATATPAELLLAAAAGADWPARWVGEWGHVDLEIGGDDLVSMGVEPGPAVGLGLEAALRAKLDGNVTDRDDEMKIALAVARRGTEG